MCKSKESLKEMLYAVYGEGTRSLARFAVLERQLKTEFNAGGVEYFTAPGRTEIIGNHTDHNGGKVLAASIGMDTIAAAWPNHSECVIVRSQGFSQPFVLDLGHLDAVPEGDGTLSLLAGIFRGCRTLGFKVEGFYACISTEVISAAGVSSSASFEMLICAIINHFFNEGRMSCLDYAKIGQYAEHHYWKKQSGLMDQLACAVGGAVFLDFSDKENPVVEKLTLPLEQEGYQIILVNTGKGHGNLSREYSEIPSEMKKAASCLGKRQLSETSLESLLIEAPAIRQTCGDRSLLRAIHFFEENRRVDDAREALGQSNIPGFLSLVSQSGNSSWKYLQNCCVPSEPAEQSVSVMLALTELFLAKIGKGACRVHGGGFAGVIMCILPREAADVYREYISAYAGCDNVFPVTIRSQGAIHLG